MRWPIHGWGRVEDSKVLTVISSSPRLIHHTDLLPNHWGWDSVRETRHSSQWNRAKNCQSGKVTEGSITNTAVTLPNRYSCCFFFKTSHLTNPSWVSKGKRQISYHFVINKGNLDIKRLNNIIRTKLRGNMASYHKKKKERKISAVKTIKAKSSLKGSWELHFLGWRSSVNKEKKITSWKGQMKW